MISASRVRPVASLVVAVLLVGATFSQRPAELARADPPRHARAVAATLDAADAADAALETAADALSEAIDAARSASANASSGTALDEERFAAAADGARAAAAPLAGARSAVGRLAGRCATLDLAAPQLAIDPATGTAVGGEIEGAREAAAGFIGLRTDASAVLDQLAAAAAALSAGDAAGATAAADRAEAALDRVEPYAAALPALLLWLETTGDLVGAVRSTVIALQEGDDDAAAAALRRLQDAAGEAAVSDRALALAISEGASRVLGTQLGRLADLAREVADTRFAVAALRGALVARETPGEAP